MTLTVLPGGRPAAAPRRQRVDKVCEECGAGLFTMTIKHHGLAFCDPLCAASYDQRARLRGDRP